MPVLVNPKQCLDQGHCFAAAACPYGAFSHDAPAKTWVIDSTICGDCPGPCLNFCNGYALRWADNLFEIDLLKGQLAGTLSVAEVAEKRAARQAEELAAQAVADAAAAAQVPAPVIVAVTQANFRAEVDEAELPVFMDCWAAWCGPCKQFAPTFAAYAATNTGTVKCVKLDTEKEKALARSLGITALPTLVMFYKGQLMDGAQGALSAQQLETWTTSRLAAIRKLYPGEPAAVPEEPAPAAPKPNKQKPQIYLP